MAGYLFHYNNEVTLALLGLSLSHLLHHSLNTNLTPPPSTPKIWALSSPIHLVHYHQQLLSTPHPTPTPHPPHDVSRSITQNPAREFKTQQNNFLTFSNRLHIWRSFYEDALSVSLLPLRPKFKAHVRLFTLTDHSSGHIKADLRQTTLGQPWFFPLWPPL